MTGIGTSHGVRADARRNHERVLAAAEELFSEHGAKTSLEEIARRAGVGVGTVYRHFPTKEALIAAVVGEMQRGLLEATQVALADPDAGAALKTLLVKVADIHSRRRLLAEEMSNHVTTIVDGSMVKDTFRSAVNEIVRRAQDVGAIRPDIGPGDVAVLMAGIAHATSLTFDIDPMLRHRYLAIMLDGLRPLDPTPLPGSPLDIEAMRRLMTDPQLAADPTHCGSD